MTTGCQLAVVSLDSFSQTARQPDSPFPPDSSPKSNVLLIMCLYCMPFPSCQTLCLPPVFWPAPPFISEDDFVADKVSNISACFLAFSDVVLEALVPWVSGGPRMLDSFGAWEGPESCLDMVDRSIAGGL